MPPKHKKKRSKSESESDSSAMDCSIEKEDRAMAMSLSAIRTTRASARACNAKNRNNMLMEAALASQSVQVHKACAFNFEELLADKKYKYDSTKHERQLFRAMDARDFNMDYYHECGGLNEVLVFTCPPEELGMKMVDNLFTVDDVLRLVGEKKMITCVKVDTQGSEDMSLKRFIDYYKQEVKPELYNVLSLEFSNTALSEHVQSPSLVRDIDWASSWPDERKNRTVTFDKEGNFTTTHNYPRVENYCLMSPNSCYTDFHIDFHGTSVWYHVKKGKKIFWIVEPTDNNLVLYDEYLKAADNRAFFGDIVTQCELVEVKPGSTLIIPSGWIHSVFTPQDSLVFGGNFLHSRQVQMQLKVLASENRIKINKKYRYPHSEETVFFFISEIVRRVTKREYIRPESRNQQNAYKEYCGVLFRDKKLHRRIPIEKNYADDGIVWDDKWPETKEYEISKAKLAEFDDEKEEKDEEKAVVLNANGLEEEIDEEDGAMPLLSPKKDITMNGTIDDEEIERRDRESEEKKRMEEAEKKNMPGGHDDFFMDPIFYHPRSFNLDAGVGATMMHTLPLSKNEPALHMDEDVLKEAIHPLAVPQLESLVVYFLNKNKVDLPHGLTRPNSLLQCFMKLLRKRRWMAECEGKYPELEPCILPDDDESRRIYEVKKEEEKKREADRKRKMEKRKAIEEGEEGEADTDWNPDEDKPKTKKGRKSGDGGGKMVVSTGLGKKTGVPSPHSSFRPPSSHSHPLLSSAKCTAHLLSPPFSSSPSTSKSIPSMVTPPSLHPLSMDLDLNGVICTDPSPSSPSPSPSTSGNGEARLAAPRSMAIPKRSNSGVVKRQAQKKDTGSRASSIVGVVTKDGLARFNGFYHHTNGRMDARYPAPNLNVRRQMSWRDWEKMSREERENYERCTPPLSSSSSYCASGMNSAMNLKNAVENIQKTWPMIPSLMNDVKSELSKMKKGEWSGMGGKKMATKGGCLSDKQQQTEVIKRQIWEEMRRMKEEGRGRYSMNKTLPSSSHAPIRLSTPSSEALRHSMQQKLGLSIDNRPNASSPQLATQSISHVSITNELSLEMVSLLVQKDPRFPQLADFSFPPSPLSQEVQSKMEWLKNSINGDSKTQLTIDQIVQHISMLKYGVLTGAYKKKGALEYRQSIEIVARETVDAKKVNSNGVVQIHHSTPSTSVISVKPANASLLMAQTPKTCIPVEKKERKEGVDGIYGSVIGVKPPVYPPHSIVNLISGMDIEKKEKKMKEEDEDEKGETENGSNKLDNESDFREVLKEPKPPEGGGTEEGEGGGGGRKGSELASSSYWGSISPPSPCSSTTTMSPVKPVKIERGRKRKRETVIKRRGAATIRMEIDLIEVPRNEDGKSPVIGTPRGKKMETPLTSRSGSLKEAKKKKKKEEETNSIVLSNEGSSGGSSRDELKGHSRWLAKKRAQQNVVVKRYTDGPEDWTPFDAFLKKNYQFLCNSYNEKPSNTLALDIKRNLWNDMMRGGGTTRWEEAAAKFRADGEKRIYWNSETVVEQEDRVVVDKGLKVIPLGGEEIDQGIERESIHRRPLAANGDEYLADEEDAIDDIMVDVEGVEDELLMEPEEMEGMERVEEAVKEEGASGVEEPLKKKNKGGRPKKEPKETINEKKRKAPKGENEDFMHTGTTPRGKGKKVKPDPNKPLIVDGVPVNPLAEPAVKNAYGYDPAMDIVPLGQGQLKSAYRRSKAQLDTPQIDAKRYKLEVKHDHLLDDDDHDDTHRDESETVTAYPRPITPHGGADIMEGINVHIGDDSTRCISPSAGPSEQQQYPSPAPSFILNQRSGSFSRRMQQTAPAPPPPLIPHAPSPLSTRRISGATTDGWGGMSGGRRRSDGGDRRDRTPGNRSPTRKSSHFSPGDALPLTPSTVTSTAAAAAAAKQTRLSQAEQFTMAPPKVIDAPRLATPIAQSQSTSDSSLVSRSLSLNGDEPLSVDVFCAQLERITADLERANAILGSTSTNGN